MASYSTVGKRTQAVEGPEKVTGRTVYAADITIPGTVWTKVLRSPFPHARILSIDTSKALALEGVLDVVTAEDLPPALLGIRMRDMPVLAKGKVRFIGEQVAAVVAENPDIAEEAVGLIDVTYQELPAVFNVEQALEEGAPKVHDNPSEYIGAPNHEATEPNVQSYVVWESGDLAISFKGADHIFENTFRTPLVPHGYLEPNACTVWAKPEGDVEVWSSNKSPYNLVDMLVKQVGAPEGRVKVNVLAVGGDFGAKSSLTDVPLCYLLSARCGRPVKFLNTFMEEMIAGPRRHPASITVRTGITSDGILCAMEVQAAMASGAYAAFKANPQITVLGIRQAGSCYRIPAIRVAEYCVYSNHVSCTQTRTPGGPQIVFAIESQLDMIAKQLGMDPVELRMKNLLDQGDATPMGQVWDGVRAKETLSAGLGKSEQKRSENLSSSGWGVAMYERPPGAGKSSASISIDPSGPALLSVSVANCGQGAYTALQQIVAETLGVSPKAVVVQAADTDSQLFDSGVGGSKTTNSTGNAAANAAQKIIDELKKAVATDWECPIDLIEYRNSVFVGPGERIFNFQDAAALAVGESESLVCTAYYDPPSERDVTSFCAQIAEVDVDTETGQVFVKRIVSAHDVGTILYPVGHQGQINGGVIQGMGFGICEETPLSDGRVTTVTLADFKLPNINDIPELDTVLLKDELGPVPYQGKAIGELPNVPTAAAIANAVDAAVGVRITDLPVTAEKVYAALKKKATFRQ